MSLITREKCGLKSRKPVIAYNIDGSIYKKESSMIKFADFLQVSQRTIRRAIKSGKFLKKKEELNMIIID
jgi:hypothetical protein